MPLALALAVLLQAPLPSPVSRHPSPIHHWLITEPAPTDTGAARVAKDYLGGERAAFPDSDATWRPITAAERWGGSWSFASVDADNVYITAVKRAEDTDAYVLRLVEWHGHPTRAVVTFGRPIARARLANLLEDPATGVPLNRDRRSVTLTLRPWEIVTLIVDAGR